MFFVLKNADCKWVKWKGDTLVPSPPTQGHNLTPTLTVTYISHRPWWELMLKVVSSENEGGPKLVLIDGYEPRTMALDNILSLKLASILFWAYFRFRSVLPNLLANSGQISEVLRAT